MKQEDLRKLCLSAILVAFAVVLDYISSTIIPWKMPAGGSISIATLFLVLNGLLTDWKYGIIGGIVFGLVSFLFDQYSMHPASIIFDYILPFGIFGLSGLFKNNEIIKKRKYIMFTSIFFVLTCIRFMSHVISGMWAYGTDLWGSIVYNFGYCFASFLLSVIIGILLMKPLGDLENSIEG